MTADHGGEESLCHRGLKEWALFCFSLLRIFFYKNKINLNTDIIVTFLFLFFFNCPKAYDNSF